MKQSHNSVFTYICICCVIVLRNSWCVNTPECAKGLEWDPSLAGNLTPRYIF